MSESGEKGSAGGAVAEEAAVEEDAAGGGGEAAGQLHAALRVAELAVRTGQLPHALPQPVHYHAGVGGVVVACAGAGGGGGEGGAEAGAGDVLVDELERVDEAHVEGLRVGRGGRPAHRRHDHRVGAGHGGDGRGRRRYREEEGDGWRD